MYMQSFFKYTNKLIKIFLKMLSRKNSFGLGLIQWEVHDPKYLRREQPEGVCKPCSEVCHIQRGIAGWSGDQRIS